LSGCSLGQQRLIKQDRFKDFTINRNKCQQRKTPQGTRSQVGVDVLLDIGLPLGSMGFTVHPDADIEQHDRRQKGRNPFHDFAAGAADTHQGLRGSPGRNTGHQCRYPTQMHIPKSVTPTGSHQHSHQGNHHEQGFEPLPQQNNQAGTEQGRIGQGRFRKQSIRIIQPCQRPAHSAFHLTRGLCLLQ